MGDLFTEPVLVVQQWAKYTEVTHEYAVLDEHGNRLGSVTEVGQTGARKLLRVLSSSDRYVAQRMEVRDAAGQPVLTLTRPATLVKSRMMVGRPDGAEIGAIAQQNMFGKIKFALLAPGGTPLGEIKAENWRAWDFAVVDTSGVEVARITKKWEGFAKAMFTTADNYVVQIHRPLDDPLRSLVVASALTVDTALRQDEDR